MDDPGDNVIPFRLRIVPGDNRREGGPTFQELAEEWLRVKGVKLVCPDNERRHIAHLAPILGNTEENLLSSAIDDALTALGNKLGPATINKVRATGRKIIKWAQLRDKWMGRNPFDATERIREKKSVWRTLSIDEVRALLPHLTAARAREVLVMLYVGLRPGELKALRRSDVDLRSGTLFIHRSNYRDQTKTGTERRVPIPEGSRPVFEAALAAIPRGSDFVFPKPDGTQQRFDVKLARVLREGLRRAGLVTGFRHTCRTKRSRCPGFEEERQDDAPATCPHCRCQLYRLGIPIPVRFYDLRHTSATLHRQAGADPLACQILLGHSPRNTTDAKYTHLTMDDLRRELSKLKI